MVASNSTASPNLTVTVAAADLRAIRASMGESQAMAASISESVARLAETVRSGIVTFEGMEASAPVASDFKFTCHGTLCILDALTPAAQKWANENLSEDRTMWGACGTVIEPRYVGDILEGIANSGLTVA